MIGQLRNYLRPELINRIDDIIVYRPQGDEVLRSIIDLELAKVSTMLAEKISWWLGIKRSTITSWSMASILNLVLDLSAVQWQNT